MPISSEGVGQILAQYERFGWTLERVLLSSETAKTFENRVDEFFGGCDLRSSDIDAAWFSRPNEQGQTAWELRALNENPFALVEVVDSDISDVELNSVFEQTESHLRERLVYRARDH
jgi:hypothetical protein